MCEFNAGEFKRMTEEAIRSIVAEKIKDFERQTGLLVCGIEIDRISTGIRGARDSEYFTGEVKMKVA